MSAKRYQIRAVKRRIRNGEWIGDPDSVLFFEVDASSAKDAALQVMRDEDFDLKWRSFRLDVKPIKAGNQALDKALQAADDLHAADVKGNRDVNLAGKACRALAAAMKQAADLDMARVVEKLDAADISYFNGWIALDGPKARRLRRVYA